MRCDVLRTALTFDPPIFVGSAFRSGLAPKRVPTLPGGVRRSGVIKRFATMKVTRETMPKAQEKDIQNDTPADETAAPAPDSETESAVEAAADEPVAEETADPAGEGPQSDSQSEPQDDPQSDSESDPAAAEPASELEQTIAERDQAVAEKAELLDRYQRAQAEFDNFRKRLVREKEEAHNYAAMDTVRSLLPVADDFERALASGKPACLNVKAKGVISPIVLATTDKRDKASIE